MLKKIHIKNFKKIGSEGIILDELEKVNYLVGENGSGKSSVLEGLFLLKTFNSVNDEGSNGKIAKTNNSDGEHFAHKHFFLKEGTRFEFKEVTQSTTSEQEETIVCSNFKLTESTNELYCESSNDKNNTRFIRNSSQETT